MCTYYKEIGEEPRCTHPCDECVWNDEEEDTDEGLVSIYDLVRESIDSAVGDVAYIHVDVLKEVIRIFDNLKEATEKLVQWKKENYDA